MYLENGTLVMCHLNRGKVKSMPIRELDLRPSESTLTMCMCGEFFDLPLRSLLSASLTGQRM